MSIFRTKTLKPFDRRKNTYSRSHRAMIIFELESQKFEASLRKYSLSNKGFNFSFIDYRDSETRKWLESIRDNKYQPTVSFKTYGPTPPHGCLDDHDETIFDIEFSCRYVIRRISVSEFENKPDQIDLIRVIGRPLSKLSK